MFAGDDEHKATLINACLGQKDGPVARLVAADAISIKVPARE
jgi:hypothetical protein